MTACVIWIKMVCNDTDNDDKEGNMIRMCFCNQIKHGTCHFKIQGQEKENADPAAYTLYSDNKSNRYLRK